MQCECSSENCEDECIKKQQMKEIVKEVHNDFENESIDFYIQDKLENYKDQIINNRMDNEDTIRLDEETQMIDLYTFKERISDEIEGHFRELVKNRVIRGIIKRMKEH